MVLSLLHTNAATALGATLVDGGATFRVWAPRARRVHVVGDFAGASRWVPDDDNLMVRDGAGYWVGFMPGVRDGDEYKFWVAGEGSEGMKRDPYARELTIEPAYPNCNCIVRDPNGFLWHDGWLPPRFHDLIIYQFHIGTFFGPDRERRSAKFLDVLDRLDYLVELGVNAIQPLPVTEFASPRSLGYDGSDIFSPEMDYQIDRRDPAFGSYLGRVNALLARRGRPPISADQLAIPINQLKALIDLCHLYGIAVLLDVVYNHAGYQIGGQDESLWFFDRAAGPDRNDSLYFTNQEHTGPVFAFWKREVRQFLIDNAKFFLDEYRVDGFRYDHVRVILDNAGDNGWRFCQALTGTVSFVDATALQVAESWPVDPYVTRPSVEGGAGFDATWHNGLRDTLYAALAGAASDPGARLDLDAVARTLYPAGMTAAWKSVQYLESHDEVYRGRRPRVAALAGGGNARSWNARSLSRLVTGLVLLAPGIPMLWMGQEFLEDKQWSDNPGFDRDSLIHWDGLNNDKAMVDHLRFTRELIALRRNQPALRSESLNVFHVHNDNRVLAFHRWLEGEGRDIVIAASFRPQTWYGYRIGLPAPGRWREVFNSDVYDNWVNPAVSGNGSGIDAEPVGFHGFGWSAPVVIPAHGFVVLAKG